VLKSLSERIEGEEVCFWYFLFDLERPKSFAYLRKNWDQNQVVHSENLFGELD